MARFMMEQGEDHRTPQEMGPLNPYARRLVHLTVAEDRADVVGEHRRRVPEDRHHFGAAVGACSRSCGVARARRRSATRRFTCFPRRHHRRDRDAARPRRASASSGSAGRRRIAWRSHLTGRVEPLAPRHATLARTTSRRRALPTRSCSPSSPRRIPTRAKTSSRSARTAARCCSRAIVDAAMAAGARLAEPGEFTLRAYLHGRIDLVQAEAVRDLVDAVTPLQARAAFDQLEGTLTDRDPRDRRAPVRSRGAARGVARFSGRGLSLRRPGAKRRASSSDRAAMLDALLATRGARPADPRRPARRDRRPAERGQIEPVQPARGRRPRDRHGHAGDDARRADRDGRYRRRADDARRHRRPPRRSRATPSRPKASRAPSRRAKPRPDRAGARSLGAARPDDDRAAARTTAARPRVVVANKADLRAGVGSPTSLACRRIEVSARTGDGLDELRQALLERHARRDRLRDTPAVTNVRHVELLERAATRCDRARARGGLASARPRNSCWPICTRRGARLEEITGRAHADDVLHAIFAKFCIGK